MRSYVGVPPPPGKTRIEVGGRGYPSQVLGQGYSLPPAGPGGVAAGGAQLGPRSGSGCATGSTPLAVTQEDFLFIK